MTIYGMTLPVVHVNGLHAAEQQFELSLIKVVQPLQRQNFVEAIEEGSSLVLLASRYTPFRHELKVLVLVGLGDAEFGTAFQQFVARNLAQDFVVDGKEQLQVLEAIILNPHLKTNACTN